MKNYSKKCLTSITQALEDTKLNKNEINNAILVEGVIYKITRIKEIVKNYFNEKKILNKMVNPDEIVAEGSTIQAAIIK